MPDRLMRAGWESQARARRERRRTWLRHARMFAPLIILIVLGAALYGLSAVQQDRSPTLSTGPHAVVAPPGALRVVDGDTVSFGGERLRLLVIDAPEIASPRCEAEYRAGLAAAAELRTVLSGRPIEIRYSGRRDVFDRPLVELSVDGSDVGAHLLSRNLAIRYAFGKAVAKLYWCGLR
jgi:endonuclease YncB( thermonuclease family)